MPRAARGRWPGTRRRRWMPGHAPSSGCRGPASGSGARDPPRGGQESPVAGRAKVRSLRAIHADGGREDRQSPGRPTIPRQSLPRQHRHNQPDVATSGGATPQLRGRCCVTAPGVAILGTVVATDGTGRPTNGTVTPTNTVVPTNGQALPAPAVIRCAAPSAAGSHSRARRAQSGVWSVRSRVTS